MKSSVWLPALGLALGTATFADAATITGTVKGPDGAPFRAAFVQARHTGMKMTVSVLSDNDGRYVIESLPAGDYRLSVRAIGHKADPKEPKSPADLPYYKDTVLGFTDEALKIVYVDYDMPGPTRFPWTAHPDKNGVFFTPEYGIANHFNWFDPKTGEMKEFPVPHSDPALIHSAVPAPDGSVWLAEAGTRRLGRWDPATQKVVEYQDDWRKHTIRVHPDGSIWSTRRAHPLRPEDGEIHPHH
jgi:hypothetical protein